MPILNIMLPTGKSEAQKTALLKQTTQAVIDSLNAPISNIRITLQEVAPENAIIAGEFGRPFALVHAILISGRTPELKASFIKAVAQAIESTVGISKQDSRVIIYDTPVTDMGVAGGITAQAAGR